MNQAKKVSSRELRRVLIQQHEGMGTFAKGVATDFETLGARIQTMAEFHATLSERIDAVAAGLADLRARFGALTGTRHGG